MKTGVVLFKIVAFIFIVFSCGTGKVHKENVTGDDYELFRGTPVWDLALAAKSQDVNEIAKIASSKKVNIDYQEPKYGETVLMLTVLNNQKASCQALLNSGANVSIHNRYNGSSAIIDAAGLNTDDSSSVEMLRLLVKFNANVNDIEEGPRQEGNSVRYSVLMRACSNINNIFSPLSKVIFLVEHGADVNYKNEYNQTALSKSVLTENLDVVLYLLQHGADYTTPVHSYDGKDYYLNDVLSKMKFPSDSKEGKEKAMIMEIIGKK